MPVKTLRLTVSLTLRPPWSPVVKNLISPVVLSKTLYSANSLFASTTKTFSFVTDEVFKKPSVAVPLVKSTKTLSLTANPCEDFVIVIKSCVC